MRNNIGLTASVIRHTATGFCSVCVIALLIIYVFIETFSIIYGDIYSPLWSYLLMSLLTDISVTYIIVFGVHSMINANETDVMMPISMGIIVVYIGVFVWGCFLIVYYIVINVPIIWEFMFVVACISIVIKSLFGVYGIIACEPCHDNVPAMPNDAIENFI